MGIKINATITNTVQSSIQIHKYVIINPRFSKIEPRDKRISLDLEILSIEAHYAFGLGTNIIL